MITKTRRQKTPETAILEKKVKSCYGEITLKIPRDRDNDFEPVVVKKNQRDISSIEDQVLSMYARGMTTRDI